jgi:hypothetical protein
MKRSSKPSKARRKKAPEPPPEAFFYEMEEREVAGQKYVEFPHFRGKPLERVELVSTPEYHAISLDFKDKMSLMLTLEPCFRLHSTLYTENGDQEFEEAWLPIHRAPWDIG